MSKQPKPFEFKVETLTFKPFNWDIYNHKISNIKIALNDEPEIVIKPFNIDTDSELLTFKSNPNVIKDIHINPDLEENKLNQHLTNYSNFIHNQSLMNNNSLSYKRRNTILEPKEKWIKINLDDDSFKL